MKRQAGGCPQGSALNAQITFRPPAVLGREGGSCYIGVKVELQLMEIWS